MKISAVVLTCAITAVLPHLGWSAITITSGVTGTFDFADQVRNDISVDANPSNDIDVTYNGTELRLTSFVAGGTTYSPLGTGVAIARRNDATPTFPTSNPNQVSGWNSVASTGAGVHTVNGRYLNTMDALFTSNNLYTGTENLFVNDSMPGNVVNNVERMDYVFTSGLTVSSGLGFAVFERGLGGPGGGGANGGFKIVAITSLSGTTPTGLGSTVVHVTDNSYSNSNLGIGLTPFRYDVFRYETAGGPEMDAFNNVNIGPQGIAGALVLTTELASIGTTIYGYSIFGEDVTASGNALLDTTDGSIYNDLSDFGNDMDMVASGAVLFQEVPAVPEPATGLFGALVLMGLASARRRRA